MKIYIKTDSKMFDNIKTEEDLEKIAPMLLVETEQDIEVGTNLSIDGKFYSLCVVSPKLHIGYVKLLKDQERFVELPREVWGHLWMCPFCGGIDHDAFELQDEEEDLECGHCGSIVHSERIVTVEYRVRPVKRNDPVEVQSCQKN